MMLSVLRATGSEPAVLFADKREPAPDRAA